MWNAFSAYCVGLITTDGCLSSDGRHIEFTSRDRQLVEYIQQCFGPTNHITTKDRGDGRRYLRIQIGNKTLYKWLEEIGLTKRKSLTLGSLNVPTDFLADFVRGHLDGDGGIVVYHDPEFPRSRRLYVRFHSGSERHLQWLQQQMQLNWSLQGYWTRIQRAYRLSYAKRESIELLGRLYYATTFPCLHRKRALAEEFLHGASSGGGGGTGIRAGLRSPCRKAWGFNSPPPHFSL